MPSATARKPDTRNRILVASLLLFNQFGASRTTTNQIADEINISPGNLHYHFKTKTDLIEAIIRAFHTDASSILQGPANESITLEDLWFFLHLLLELIAAYRFLFRDFESILNDHPRLAPQLRKITDSVTRITEDYLRRLAQMGVLRGSDTELDELYRNFVIITLFSERFDALSGKTRGGDESMRRAARSALRLLLPLLGKKDAALANHLADQYE